MHIAETKGTVVATMAKSSTRHRRCGLMLALGNMGGDGGQKCLEGSSEARRDMIYI
jgi:hypothetical protein